MTTMSVLNNRKLNYLLRHWPKGIVGAQSWLNSMGIYRQLADRYCQSQWLERIGPGAYSLIDDKVEWMGAVYALQAQLDYAVHVGAKTALELQGYSHYVNLGKGQPVWLFIPSKEYRLLPRWFISKFMSENKIHYLHRDLFKSDEDGLGLTTIKIQDFQLRISAPERAIIECLNLLPKYFSLEDIKFLMQNMTTLRPQLLQSLLEKCQSFKVKRLFLLFAENEGHAWVNKLNLESISLGRGKRVIGKGGYYYPKYQLSLPIKLESHEGYHYAEK